MAHKRFFIWVEGADDVRFFDKIIKPRLQKKYDWVEVRSYARLKKEKVHSFLKSIKAMNADYLFSGDINNAPCITAKKEKIQDGLRNIDEKNIIIVKREIEGWYLAGLSDTSSKEFKIPSFATTENITKEQFNKLIPKTFESRIDFMLEILKHFSIITAQRKNKSFKYLVEKDF